MMARHVPFAPVRGGRCVVATADQVATQAGMWAFAQGGNAADAAIAASAAMAVVGPHLCGMGGDLLAVVAMRGGELTGLNASGRSGSGADAAALRAEGHSTMPFREDVRSITVPGCVDGWVALHERFGSLDFERILTPAIRLAASGFPASPLLVLALSFLDEHGRAQLHELADQAVRPGARVRRPGAALALHAIARGGRDAFYGGAFGEGLVALGHGLFTEADLKQRHADWVDVLTVDVLDIELATLPPNTQGYLTLATAQLAAEAGLPTDPDDAQWAHLLIEAATAAAYDRPEVLHDGADGHRLLADALSRGELLDVAAASRRPSRSRAGDTTYLCTADADGLAVSLLQSNAAGFGSFLVEPTTSINLQNRGMAFSLDPGHPAEYGPGRRPPHTLCPAMARHDGTLAGVLGTMGGDAQPQIVAQLAARLFHAGESVTTAVAAPRWVLRGPRTGFDTWTEPEPPTVVVEEGAPAAWIEGLRSRGHDVVVGKAFDGAAGHAHAIVVEPTGSYAAAADPRTLVGSAAAL